MRISLYIAKEVLFAFLISFLFFFFIFFLNQILLLADQILSKRAPLPEVILLILFSLPSVIALAAPFASLLGVLLSIGRLSGDREILAAQACGVPHFRMFVPAILLGLVFTFISFTANDILLPIGTMNFNKVFKNLILSTPELELGAHSVNFYKNALIITGDVTGRQVHGLSILDKTGEQQNRLLSAARAMILTDPGAPGVLKLSLEDVVGIIPDAKKTATYEYFTARHLQYNIVLREMSSSVQNVSAREMTSVDLARQISVKESEMRQTLAEARAKVDLMEAEFFQAYWTAPVYSNNFHEAEDRQALLLHWQELKKRDLTDKILQNWKTEFYQKFSIPLACVCFILLAYPLAIFQHRKGFTLILGVGLFIAVVYWASLLMARALSLEWNWPPEIALFLPNIFILIGGVGVFLRMRR